MNKDSILTIAFIIIIIFAAIGCSILVLIIRNYYEDKKNFNNGRCAKCGGKLEFFHLYFNGERGYRCPNCNTCITIVYPIDKKYLKNKAKKEN